MRPILAIARQTFWEGMRMRIVLVAGIILGAIILLLPLIMRGDETLAGQLQAFLDYSFMALGIFASLATVFFSCSTLANEIKNCQMHMVVTKPISRFQILLGKWIGVNLLNCLIVLICSVVIFAFAGQIAGRQEKFSRDRMKVRDVIWTARTAATPVEPDVSVAVAAFIEEKIAVGTFLRDSADAKRAADEKEKELLTLWRVLRPTEGRFYEFENLPTPDSPDTVIQVRVRARGMPVPRNEQLPISWFLVDPETNEPLQRTPTLTEGRSGDIIEFLFRGQAAIKNGKVTLLAINQKSDGTIPTHEVVLEGEDWLQIMYRVGSFEANFARNVVMILAKLAFLSAIGLTFGVFVSFPVACMCTFTAFLVVAGWDWWFEVIGGNLGVFESDYDPYGRFGPFVRFFLVFFMWVMPNFNEFNGTTKLIGGEVITNWLMLKCVAHTLVFGAVLLLLVGWAVFSQKEIAEITV